MLDTNACPCGSQVELAQCCLPVIEGKKPAQTAEALLRARYTAFTRGDVDFILSSHHSRTRDEVKRDEIEEWAKDSEWQGLKIVEIQQGGSQDQAGTLIFAAQYRDLKEDKVHEHWEKSFFEKEAGLWKFVDAQGVHWGTYKRTDPKVGRNDPCPCGSGKKYKKCCANSPG
jgi:SEC-C motif-containing protein